MPKNAVHDPITDQEMAFSHLVLSGTMNDRRAAEAVGLDPSAAKAKKHRILSTLQTHLRTQNRGYILDESLSGVSMGVSEE